MNRILDAFLAAARALTATNRNDQLCCVIVRDTMRRRFGDAVVARAPLELWHLWPEGRDPWGPISAAVRCGIATVVTTPVVGAWHIVQVWTGKEWGPPGHTFLVYVGADGMVLRLDSADKRGPDNGILDNVEDGPAAAVTTFAALTENRKWRLAVLHEPG